MLESLRRLSRHAIFPVLLYLPLSQMVRDQYPISHFPMYSNPTEKPLKIHRLTNGQGELLPVLTRAGVTPSHMSKMWGSYLKKLLEKEAKQAKAEGREVRSEETFFEPAAVEVLEVLRQQSLKRTKNKHLREEIQLRETQVGFGDGRFIETDSVLGRLPAMEVKP
jgi:hypothetical protein